MMSHGMAFLLLLPPIRNDKKKMENKVNSIYILK